MAERGFASGNQMLAVCLPGFANRLGSKVLDGDGAQMPDLVGNLRVLTTSQVLQEFSTVMNFLPMVLSRIKWTAFVALFYQILMHSFCVHGSEWQAHLALESVVERARVAHLRIPQEVRNAVVKRGAPEDGTTASNASVTRFSQNVS